MKASGWVLLAAAASAVVAVAFWLTSDGVVWSGAGLALLFAVVAAALAANERGETERQKRAEWTERQRS